MGPKPTDRPPRRRNRVIADATDPTIRSTASTDDRDADAEEHGRVEIRRRVAEMLSSGYSPGRVAEDLMEQPTGNEEYPGGFGVSRATAWRYIEHVREQWRQQEIADRPFHLARMLEIQQFGIREAARDRHWTGFNGGVRNVMDMLGLKVTKVEMQTGGVDALIEALKATPAQREARLAELEALEAKELDDAGGTS